MTKTSRKGSFILPFLLLIIVGCSKHYNLNKFYSINSDDIYNLIGAPDEVGINEFIESFRFTNDSLVYTFEKGYLENLIDSDVKSFYIYDELILYISKNLLTTNYRYCQKISLDKDYQKITYYNGYVALDDSNSIDLYSLFSCGKLSVNIKKVTNNYIFLYPVIAFLKEKNVYVYDCISNNEILNLHFNYDVVNVFRINKYICIALKEGSVIFVDLNEKKIVKILHYDRGIIYLNKFNDNIYLLDNSTNFRRFKIKKIGGNFELFNNLIESRNINIKNKKNIHFGSNYPGLFIDNIIYMLSKDVALDKNGSFYKFDLIDRDTAVFLRRNHDLVIVYIDSPRYISKVHIGRVKVVACKKENYVYINDVDGKCRRLDLEDGKVEIVNSC
ncbi:MAG: hypothetical protein SVN78_04185, partial [Deferribacterota bacterium]|nr:hypothetical protein [Deferribacterota bacterium]